MKQYFNLTKGQGYKLIVNKVYDKQKINTIDNYNELVQLLLTDYFLDKQHIVASTNFLLLNVSLINAQYSKNRNNKNNYAKEKDVDIKFIYDFFNTTDDTLKSAIETALRNLRYRSLIMYSWEPIVVDYDNRHRVATPSERHAILKAENVAKSELGYKDYREIMFKPKLLKESRRIQTRHLNKEGYKIRLNYMGYNINILQDEMAKAQEKMIVKWLDNAERNDYKSKLNLTIVNRLLENAKNRGNRATCPKVKDDSKYFRAIRSDFNYMEIMSSIIDDNIKSAKNLTEDDLVLAQTLAYITSEPYQN